VILHYTRKGCRMIREAQHDFLSQAYREMRWDDSFPTITIAATAMTAAIEALTNLVFWEVVSVRECCCERKRGHEHLDADQVVLYTWSNGTRIKCMHTESAVINCPYANPLQVWITASLKSHTIKWRIWFHTGYNDFQLVITSFNWQGRDIAVVESYYE
jgi:hypothetical protein